ncbi:hypothetical protein [Pseudomonas sp. Marseille-QA0892]
MKLSDGFDARRLRPKGSSSWRVRLGCTFAALLIAIGAMLIIMGAAALAGRPLLASGLDATIASGLAAFIPGVLITWVGFLFWRRCRRGKRGPDGLAMSPHLLRRRN